MSDIPTTMRAVRLHGKGFESISIDEVPVPVPNDDQLLARVDAAGVCTSILKVVAQGSDHTFINGRDLAKSPVTLGDEGCVTIVAAGRNVADKYPLGGRYAVQPAVDHPPVYERELYRDGGEGMFKVAVGYGLPGHLAEYMLVTEETLAAECLLRLPSDNIPFFAGALCEPFSCVISAQDRHVHIFQDSPASPRKAKLGLLEGGIAMVVGAGPMGRMHAEAALRFCPAHLMVVDVADERLQWCRDLLPAKAEVVETSFHAVTADKSDALLHELSHGKGADDVIVAVGHRGVQIEAQQWLAKGGVLDLFGGLKKGEHIIDLDALRVHYDDIRVVGSSGGSPADLATGLSMTAKGQFDPGLHLDMVGGLEQFTAGLAKVRDAEVDGKIVLYPHIPVTELCATLRWDAAKEQEFLASRRAGGV